MEITPAWLIKFVYHFTEGFESKHKRPLGEQYKDYDRFRATGAPLPLANKPIICRMTDNGLTLLWKCSLPIGPREPVTYLVEMEEQPNGKWLIERAGIVNYVRTDIEFFSIFLYHSYLSHLNEFTSTRFYISFSLSITLTCARSSCCW